MTDRKRVLAVWKQARISPYKARLVASLVTGLQPDYASTVLLNMPQKAAAMIRKVLLSAVANAENNENLDLDEMVIESVRVDQASVMKRVRFRARGRRDQRLKRSSHIMVSLIEKQEVAR